MARPYEMTVSKMFGVPLEQIVRGRPEYAYRQKGKVAVLACGYQGSVGALIAMGALRMGLMEDELPDIVAAWRRSNPHIVRLWRAMEDAAIRAVKDRAVVRMQFGLKFHYQSGVLFIRLPSGRSLAYVRPRIELDERFNKYGLTYEGVELGKWCRIRTYGGKLVENCLAADTLVLTAGGWKPIIDVKMHDLLWDGVEWVKHGGVISKGVDKTIRVDGVGMTEDHLVLTERGWRNASSCKGYNRQGTKLPDCYEIRGFRRKKIVMADTMRLRERVHHARHRIPKRETEVLRMYARQADKSGPNDPWYEQTPSLCSVEVDDRSVQTAYPSGMGKLRRSGHQSLQQMGKKFSKLLGGHGFNLQKGSDFRKVKCGRGLHPRKLQVGNLQTAKQKQTEQSDCEKPIRENDCRRIVRKNGYRGNNTVVQNQYQLPNGVFTTTSGHYEPVYDIVNSGERNRFTVLGSTGAFIVHNCVQAIARDCLAESLLRLDKAGYKIAFHVHDEVVLDVPCGTGSLEKVVEIMGRDIDWAPGLPMQAEGFETDYYKKD